MRRALLALSIPLATTALAQTPLPSHGPAKGYLVITGGVPDYKNFLALAGGKDAHIVVIPTAAITRPDEKRLPPYCSAPGPFAGLKCTVLHTTDRKVADSPAFVAPLRDATGVYLEGGRHWRLADAYLGTLTLREIFALLDRGGVIMGGSAGATIQGSFMVRGSSDPDDNTIMMAPSHLVVTPFMQHLKTRAREALNRAGRWYCNRARGADLAGQRLRLHVALPVVVDPASRMLMREQMRSASNPLKYDYRNLTNVARYAKLVARNPDGSTEGRDPREVPLAELGDFPSTLQAIRAKCIDCCAGSRSEVAKCTAIGCALWPYRTGHNPRRAGTGRAANFSAKLPPNEANQEPDE
jgi:peptidase E